MKDNRSKSTRNYLNQSGQVDRSTFNPLVNSITKPSLSKQNHSERVSQMAQKIMNQVNRLYNNQSQIRAITKQMLKQGGSKLFYDVFAILIRGIDQKIDREEVNLEFIIDILKLFNYNGNLNKNIFQPIGAPHTWFHCLSILEFIAEVVAITSSFRYHSREFLKSRDVDKDQNYVTLKAVLQNNPEMLREKLEHQCHELEKRCAQLNNCTMNTELAIKNMHSQQKNLEQIDSQITKQKEKVRQFQQEIIQQEHEKNRLESEIAAVKNKIREGQSIQANLSDQVAALQYRLDHNEVTPDQSVRLEEEIRQGEYQQQILQQNIQNLVQQYRNNLQISLNQIKESFRKHQLSSIEISRHTACQMRGQTQALLTLKNLCEFPQTILSSNEIRQWGIQNEVNRMFTALFLNSNARNAEKGVEQSKKRVMNLKVQQQTLKSKMKNLNDRILQLRYLISEQTMKKQNLTQNITAKENKAKQLKYQIEAIKTKRISINNQIQATKLEIQNIQHVCDELMEQIAGIVKDKQTFQQEITKNIDRNQIIINESKTKVYEELSKNKAAINDIHEKAVSQPEFQEEIVTQEEEDSADR